jgi:hypothetical protein
MSFQDIIVGNYRFYSFLATRTGVTFCVARLDGEDVNEGDRNGTIAILDELGKWENVIKTGLHLLSELKIVQVDQTTLQNYERIFGRELYSFQAEIDNLSQRIDVTAGR